ncbi:helix-turn-helix domain-containing protein [Desertimonas flava]|uniref:helix-turn-helix domain-containing protein n=1 Tax=Desertimonas flava TaxID=2064846 RepID=UPI000E34B27D|nr:helix-turn-helix domain-containing protein [Desertimonas flava]
MPAPDGSPVGEPWLLTVEQAARLLQIGRTLAYELVGRFEASGGEVGIPVVRVGRTLRVPRAELADRLRRGGVTVSGRGDGAPPRRAAVVDDRGGSVAPRRGGRQRRGGPESVQPPLFPAG